MKRLVMEPEGWPCTLSECRPGHFLFNDSLCLKDEYGTSGGSYCDSGEFFTGGKGDALERQTLIVQPVRAVWEEYEE